MYPGIIYFWNFWEMAQPERRSDASGLEHTFRKEWCPGAG